MMSQSTGTPPEYTLLSYSKMEKHKIFTCFNVNFKVPVKFDLIVKRAPAIEALVKFVKS